MRPPKGGPPAQYSYGTAGANNGNIFTITNVKDSTRTQSFTYDPLNRLIMAGDNGHWANSYAYDAWGNLTNKTPGSPAGENMNQPADSNNHLSGLTYDAAGNVTNDGLGGVFVFDAENRIKTAGSVTYTYDADGRRIQKSTGINYWYGPGGQVFAETDSAGNWTNYVFFGGERLARNVPQPSPNPADIKYYITDHLQSTAMFVDKAGTTAAILDDNDMYPWGGVVPGVGKTTSNNTVKFTSQYRDTDTTANLDYFGARYYSNTIGRFMSPDWAAKPTTVPYAKFGDPQSLNLYSYVENGPINRIDPTGHCFTCIPGWNGSEPTSSTTAQDRQRAYEDLQALGVRTSRQMATEQNNVPLSGDPTGDGTEPQFQFGINRWMYRMDRKIDKVLAPWAQALENVMARLSPGPSAMVICTKNGICWTVPVSYGIVFPAGGVRNVAGGTLTAERALVQGEKWVGAGYKEIAPGVYRSADGLRQFRMTTSDLVDPRQGPHVHFESISPDGRTIIENSHVKITNP
jgi:RHS repeat-associated protein